MKCILPTVCLLLIAGNAPGRQVAQLKLTNDLKTIGIAYFSYVDTKGAAPTTPEELAAFFENDKRLLALLKDGDIVFLYGVKPLQMTDGTSNTVLAYVKDAPTKGGMVLFGDASVRKLTVEEFTKAPKAKK